MESMADLEPIGDDPENREVPIIRSSRYIRSSKAVAPFKLLILLVVLYAEKGVLAFESWATKRWLVASGRDCSRMDAPSPSHNFGCANGRVRSRLFTSMRLA
jgi:hypothetical protein